MLSSDLLHCINNNNSSLHHDSAALGLGGIILDLRCDSICLACSHKSDVKFVLPLLNANNLS